MLEPKKQHKDKKKKKRKRRDEESGGSSDSSSSSVRDHTPPPPPKFMAKDNLHPINGRDMRKSADPYGLRGDATQYKFKELGRPPNRDDPPHIIYSAMSMLSEQYADLLAEKFCSAGNKPQVLDTAPIRSAPRVVSDGDHAVDSAKNAHSLVGTKSHHSGKNKNAEKSKSNPQSRETTPVRGSDHHHSHHHHSDHKEKHNNASTTHTKKNNSTSEKDGAILKKQEEMVCKEYEVARTMKGRKYVVKENVEEEEVTRGKRTAALLLDDTAGGLPRGLHDARLAEMAKEKERKEREQRDREARQRHKNSMDFGMTKASKFQPLDRVVEADVRRNRFNEFAALAEHAFEAKITTRTKEIEKVESQKDDWKRKREEDERRLKEAQELRAAQVEEEHRAAERAKLEEEERVKREKQDALNAVANEAEGYALAVTNYYEEEEEEYAHEGDDRGELLAIEDKEGGHRGDHTTGPSSTKYLDEIRTGLKNISTGEGGRNENILTEVLKMERLAHDSQLAKELAEEEELEAIASAAREGLKRATRAPLVSEENAPESKNKNAHHHHHHHRDTHRHRHHHEKDNKKDNHRDTPEVVDHRDTTEVAAHQTTEVAPVEKKPIPPGKARSSVPKRSAKKTSSTSTSEKIASDPHHGAGVGGVRGAEKIFTKNHHKESGVSKNNENENPPIIRFANKKNDPTTSMNPVYNISDEDDKVIKISDTNSSNPTPSPMESPPSSSSAALLAHRSGSHKTTSHNANSSNNSQQCPKLVTTAPTPPSSRGNHDAHVDAHKSFLNMAPTSSRDTGGNDDKVIIPEGGMICLNVINREKGCRDLKKCPYEHDSNLVAQWKAYFDKTPCSAGRDCTLNGKGCLYLHK